MTDKIEKRSAAVGSQETFAEKRREERYKVPDASKQYIKLQVKSGNEFVPAVLGNFSRIGILFECPVAFSCGDRTECIIAISLALEREITFGIEVKYCYEDHGSFIMGAAIDTIADQNWFDAFVEVHDLIVLRQGSI
jgi:hypothetical protein